MHITQMQHFMVLSKDLEKTRWFYCDVLGMRTGPRPPFDFEGLWIYIDDVAVVHVAGLSSYESTGRLEDAGAARHGSGSVDHIAFAADNWDELVASFEAHGIRYRAPGVPGGRLQQIFLHDPDGIQIEINVRASASG